MIIEAIAISEISEGEEACFCNQCLTVMRKGVVCDCGATAKSNQHYPFAEATLGHHCECCGGEALVTVHYSPHYWRHWCEAHASDWAAVADV